MTKPDNIFLFSKTSYSDVNHIPILQTSYLQPQIDFSSYDYIIATSKEVFSALDKIGSWNHLNVLAISESTALAAKEHDADILDIAQGQGKDIVKLVEKKYSGLKGLYPHASVVAFDVKSALVKRDISIDSFIVYETSCSEHKPVELPFDAVCVFTSPSSIECFLNVYEFLPSYKVVCIGETTRSALPDGIDSYVSEIPSIKSTVACAKSLLR